MGRKFGWHSGNLTCAKITSSSTVEAGGSEKHAFDFATTGSVTSGGNVVGANFVLTTSGTAGAWASAVYAKIIQGTTKNVNGYLSAAEFEVVNTNTNVSDWFPLVLNANSTTNGQHSSYIALRSYGSTALNSFLWIEDQTIGSDGDTTSLVAANNPTAATHTIRVYIDDTAYYLMVCNAASLGS